MPPLYHGCDEPFKSNRSACRYLDSCADDSTTISHTSPRAIRNRSLDGAGLCGGGPLWTTNLESKSAAIRQFGLDAADDSPKQVNCDSTRRHYRP
jgi:hypothetical protein